MINGKAMRRLRDKMGITQQKVDQYIGAAYGTTAQVENGYATFNNDQFRMVLELLKCDAKDILSEDHKPAKVKIGDEIARGIAAKGMSHEEFLERIGKDKHSKCLASWVTGRTIPCTADMIIMQDVIGVNLTKYVVTDEDKKDLAAADRMWKARVKFYDDRKQKADQKKVKEYFDRKKETVPCGMKGPVKEPGIKDVLERLDNLQKVIKCGFDTKAFCDGYCRFSSILEGNDLEKRCAKCPVNA